MQKNLLHLRGVPPIWSSVRGQFTPWITHRGCFHETILVRWSLTGTNLLTSNFHYLFINSAGNCYFQCKCKNYTNGGCVNKANIFFGLQKCVCLCLYNNTNVPNILKYKIQFFGGTSIYNSERGGFDYFSLYESMNINYLMHILQDSVWLEDNVIPRTQLRTASFVHLCTKMCSSCI